MTFAQALFGILGPQYGPQKFATPSIDNHPWAHPFLAADNIGRFRVFSEQVWHHALAHEKHSPRQLNCAFAVNMAQNMYKWAKLAAKYGGDATLYLNPQDHSAISRPEWEEFAGEYSHLFDSAGFLKAHPELEVGVKLVLPENEGGELLAAYRSPVSPGWRRMVKTLATAISPELGFSLFLSEAAKTLKTRSPSVRHFPLLSYGGAYPYFQWAEMLAQHDVTYIASTPFPAYAGGKPYCIFPVGGDLQYDCGRPDDHGSAMRASFSSARFVLVSNPHALGHCRRIGLTNAVYLPYPMDSDHYCPGKGVAREDWMARFGGEVFVLTAARIDRGVKGHTEAFFDMLVAVVAQRPMVRFIFLGWGESADGFSGRVAALGLQERLIMLPPVGKQMLIDYYRSCDIVLDQFVYGYYGATALEAAAIGKPVIMKLRAEQYSPLYCGDVAPVLNASTPNEIEQHLLNLIDAPERRAEIGAELRHWLVRNHGEQKTVPLMLALLRLAADKVPLPAGLINPLSDRLTAVEREYHKRCQQEGSSL